MTLMDEGHIRKQFDQHLLTLKLHEPNLKMHEEVSATTRRIYADNPLRSDLHTRLIEAELTILEKYLGVVDRLAREVWQLQGNAITPEFVRALPHMLMLGIIEARAGAIKHGIELHNIRTRQRQDITPFLHHLRQTIEQLRATVLNRYEAEARTLDHQLRSEIRQTQVSGDQKMETAWMAEVEVLERRLNDWADKSRPEFRKMVERKQQLQRELETLSQARAQTPYNPAMPLDKDARRYADTLFTDKLEQSSREHQAQVVATTNKLSSRGMLASGMYYSELARLGVEYVKTIAHAKADSLISAYERSKLPLDDEAAEGIRGEALEWCERQGASVATNVQAKASQAGMPNLGLAETVTRQIAGIQAEIRRKVARKALEVKFDGRGGAIAATPPEPELKDDLLPILPRRRLDPELGELVANANELAPLALLMIDIDNFKAVNDRFQHHVGDEVLKGIASAIKSVCELKGRCYRYGGDEIAVLLPNHSLAEGRAVAERILGAVADVKFEGYPDRMTLSIGVASLPGSCEKGSELSRCADAAMYKAKEGGKNQVRVAEL